MEDLTDIRRRHEDSKIVLTSGTYDLLHAGHLSYLEAVKSLGNVVVVMLSGDNRIKARKGPSRPIIPEADRAKMLDALEVVDYVFIDPATKPPDQIDPIHEVIVRDLDPDVYATDGEDIRFWDILDKSKLVVLPRSDENVSTTAIIARIKEQ